MNVYSFDRLTGEFLCVADAFAHPARPDEFLMPAFSTEIAPPDTIENQCAVWSGEDWRIVADHRGETWFMDQQPVIVTSLGDPSADGLVPDRVIPAAERRNAHRQALAQLEMTARSFVVSPGNLRLLQIKAGLAAEKVTIDAKGKTIDKRTEADRDAAADIARVSARYTEIALHFAEQEAALDDLPDADLENWKPLAFPA